MAISKSTADQIQSWYTTYLGREADAGGLQNWASALDSGANVSDLQSAFQRDASSEISARQSAVPATSSGGGGSSTGLINSIPGVSFADYNGKQVRVDDYYKKDLTDNAADLGKRLGRTITAQEYDAMINPDTYGARWGNVANPGKSSGPALLSQTDLTQRSVSPATETVSGQMGSLLSADSPYMQSARARGQRAAASRGLINSSMAGTAGESAAIDAALQIATPDAATYGRASDYNTALANQTAQYNADVQNDFTQRQLDRNQQQSLAQMQDATSRYTAELSSNTSRYNTDADYRRTIDANRDSLVNNILMSGDSISPDRKAAMLEQLGMGTAARRDAGGNVIPGTGLAGAIYVIDSVSADLVAPSQQQFRGIVGGNAGGVGNGDGGDGGGSGGDGGFGGGISV